MGGSDFIKEMIPGQSNQLQKKIDVLGNEVKYEPNSALRMTKIVSTAKDSPETRILESAKYSPTEPSTKLTASQYGQTKEYQLKPLEAEQYLKEMGKATALAIRFVGSMKGFNALPQAQKEYILQQAISSVRNEVTKKYKIKYLR
jgi:hypothetical protein